MSEVSEVTFSKRVKIKRVINKDNIDSRFTHFTPTRDSDKDTHSLALSASKLREFLKLCPLIDPDDTALLTATLQIPSSEGMETIQLGPMKKLDCRRSEELSGSLKRQGSGRFCPNPNPLHRQKEFPEGARSATESESVSRLIP